MDHKSALFSHHTYTQTNKHIHELNRNIFNIIECCVQGNLRITRVSSFPHHTTNKQTNTRTEWSGYFWSYRVLCARQPADIRVCSFHITYTQIHTNTRMNWPRIFLTLQSAVCEATCGHRTSVHLGRCPVWAVQFWLMWITKVCVDVCVYVVTSYIVCLCMCVYVYVCMYVCVDAYTCTKDISCLSTWHCECTYVYTYIHTYIDP